MITSCWQIITSSSSFRFNSVLEQSTSWIPDKESMILNYSLMTTFPLKKAENNQNCYPQSSYYCFKNRYYFSAKNDVLMQKILTIPKFRDSWDFKVYFLKLHMCLNFNNKFKVFSIMLLCLRKRGRIVLPRPSHTHSIINH